jgi:8-oxo-dGTP diphosphatase
VSAAVPPAPAARRPRIEVVAAVITAADGRFLLAERPAGKPYAGYWEFPGGKVEPGEPPAQALSRELHEELGIVVTRAHPWITRDYDYEHADVRLRFYRVLGWTGDPHGREGQRFAWQRAPALTVAPMLPANGPIFNALSLPAVYGISNASQIGADRFLSQLEIAVRGGLRLVQIREKSWSEEAVLDLVQRAVKVAHPHGAQVIVNGSSTAARLADGVHLAAAELMNARARPDAKLVGASCHDARELLQAARLGLDFVVLGPVCETASHPGARLLGWEGVRHLTANYSLPVYGIGGLTQEDMGAAWNAGAHGIAMLRGAWGGD